MSKMIFQMLFSFSSLKQVTRSIGDDDLKPAVTAEPEITETILSAEDEYLVRTILRMCFCFMNHVFEVQSYSWINHNRDKRMTYEVCLT